MVISKPIIGIIPTSNYLLTDDTFKDTYRFGNNYIKSIIDNGGIPLLIPYVDDKVIMESLELCDGLLLPGGNRVLSTNFEVIDYFYNSGKPILGICLGMQTLAMYSVNKDNNSTKRIIKNIDTELDHWPIELNRDNNDELVHDIQIKKDTKLYQIYQKKLLSVNSVHKCTITEVGKEFIVSALSEDGLIEGIEYNGDDKFILGVQFHPEVVEELSIVFSKFINECKKEL